MHTLVLGLLMCVMGFGLLPAEGFAQEADAAAEESETAVPSAIEYVEPSSSELKEDQHRREDLERKARRSRNALIGTSATAVVGLPMLIAGAQTRCIRFDDPSGGTQTRCDRVGKTLVGIGLPLAIGGLTGALISGIILGVRKGKLRDIKKRSEYSSTKRLRWDPLSSQFVF